MQSLSTCIPLESLYSLKYSIETMFTRTVFETLLFESSSVLPPAQRGTVSKRVKSILKYFPSRVFVSLLNQCIYFYFKNHSI